GGRGYLVQARGLRRPLAVLDYPAMPGSPFIRLLPGFRGNRHDQCQPFSRPGAARRKPCYEVQQLQKGGPVRTVNDGDGHAGIVSIQDELLSEVWLPPSSRQQLAGACNLRWNRYSLIFL